MGVLEAWRTLRQADLGFKIEWGPTADQLFKVIVQDPTAGTEVDPGTTVTMTLGLPEFLFEERPGQLPSTPEGGGAVSTPTAPPAGVTTGSIDATGAQSGEASSTTP
jgi:hypothetical protein